MSLGANVLRENWTHGMRYGFEAKSERVGMRSGKDHDDARKIKGNELGAVSHEMSDASGRT